eukprot:s217_g18.t5
MIGAYHSVISAFEFVTGARPAGASEGYTAMPSRSQAPCSVPNPLLELGPATSTALPQYRTATSWGQGMRAATVETAAAAATPLPAPQSLPSLLLHRRRESQALVHAAAGANSHDAGLRGLGPAAAGADSPDAALRGSRQLQSRGADSGGASWWSFRRPWSTLQPALTATTQGCEALVHAAAGANSHDAGLRG